LKAHGDRAIAEAAQKAGACEKRGESGLAETWRRRNGPKADARRDPSMKTSAESEIQPTSASLWREHWDRLGWAGR